MSVTVTRILGLLGVAATLALGCSSSKKIQTGTPCVLNSDCNNPLSCTYGTCHEGCRSTVDCTTPGMACTKVDGFGVCLLPTESKCTSENPTCPKGLTCAVDLRCRSVCTTAATDCMGAQVCVGGVCADATDLVGGDLPHNRTGMDGGTPNGQGDAGGKDSSGGTGADAAVDAPVSDGAGSAGSDGGKIDPGKGDALATADVQAGVTPCPSPQTQFGFIAQGDSNPNFTSGVGVRTATSMLIFSAYSGPAPSGFDGGAGYTTPGADGGVPTVNLVYVQAFDPVKSKAKGPASVLFQAASGPQFTVDDVSIAPTGEIALLHSQGQVEEGYQNALYASFLTPTSDTTGAGVQLDVTVQIESAVLMVNGKTGYANFPRAIWSPASRAFVFSWLYGAQTTFGYGNGIIKVRKFLPSGQGAGGDTNNVIGPGYGGGHDQSAVGTSGDMLGVGSASADCNGGCSGGLLTILNAKGQVGETIDLKAPFIINWITVAGTDTGFVGLFGSGSTVSTSFVPTVALADAGAPVVSDGGVAKVIPGFTVNSAATRARAISDNTGGVGGVGVVLLEPNGASFLYVNSDGKTYVGPGTAISGSGGFMAAVSNFGGSFGVSLYNSTSHSTQMVASGCVR
jgi:hypothetical protein